jgi:hypothetical protein
MPVVSPFLEGSNLRLRPSDLYRLRRAHLRAEAEALAAQRAQLYLRRLLLDLERRYGLLAREATLDIATGIISLAIPKNGRGEEGNGEGTRTLSLTSQKEQP